MSVPHASDKALAVWHVQRCQSHEPETIEPKGERQWYYDR